MNIGNVRAGVFNTGNLFWQGLPMTYEVPKGSGIQAHFSDYLVFGGMVDGELPMVSAQYGPFELWPGRIPDDGLPPTSCAEYDRFHEIQYEQLIGGFDGQEAIASWPVQDGAPWVERDGFPGYSPATGDLPMMRGDQYIWWTMNDLGGPHEFSKTPALGVDVLSEAWAFDVVGDLGNTTFYRQTIVNRSISVISDMYVGRFADVDLGTAFDDYLGSDSTLSLAYFYNADNNDDDQYGPAPPAFGFTTLEAHHSRGGLPSDVGAGPGSFMTSIMAPSKNSSLYEPRDGEDFYWFLKGYWNDGVPVREGGTGWDTLGPVTSFAYPGDPVTRSFWSQMNDGKGGPQAPNDKRIVGSYGPFDLAPGDSVSFTWAYVWARGTDHLDSVSRLKTVAAYLHEVKGALIGYRTEAPRFIDGNLPETPQYPFWVDEPYPNPASDRVTLSMSLTWDAPVMITVHDMLGRERQHATFDGQPGPITHSLDVSSLPPGAYQIRVMQRGKSTYQRVVKL